MSRLIFQSLILLFFYFFISFVLSCGRSWRGEKFGGREILIIPKSSEIFSAPQMDIEIRQWDFTLDNSDIPHVSFYNSFQGALSYATIGIDGKWDIESIDPLDKGTGIIAGSSPNIFFVNEKLHVVYLASSIRDKVPKFYIIKEAVRDPLLKTWKCRVVKKWNSPISVIRSGYIKSVDKIGVIFFDSEDKKLIFGAFSPAKDLNEMQTCKTPKTEDEEEEKSDIKYTGIYYFGQENIRLKYEIDKTCNTVSAKVGFSVDFIPTLTRRRENITGISLYDPTLNQTYWIEIMQNSVVNWILNQNDEFEIKREDETGKIQSVSVEYLSRTQENLCVPASSIMYKVELSKPADTISKVFYKSSEGLWRETKFFTASPKNIYLFAATDTSYPLEISLTYKPSFATNIYNLGTAKTNLSVSSDKDGNIHIADFIFIPPLMAVEYGILSIDENGNFNSRFETLDGGGQGLYTQGTGGTAIAVRSDSIPIVAYFSPFTADLKISIPVRETWISVPKLTGPVSGINPKMLLNRTQNIAVLLSPVVYGGKVSLMMIFVPITL